MNKFLLILFVFVAFIGCTSAKYYGPRASVEAQNSLDRFSNRIAKEYNMTFIRISTLDLVDSKNEGWATNLMSRQKMDLESGREMTLDIIYKFWNEITQNACYQKDLDLSYYDYGRDNTLTPERMGFKIGFWDPNVDRYPSPYLSQIKVREGKIYYYYADPETQALQEPIVETFREAKEKVSSSF